jgi:hypothetical protein
MHGCNFGGVVPIWFVTIWPEVQEITLTHQPYSIQWRWTDSETVIELGELSH